MITQPIFEWDPESHMATCIVEQNGNVYYGTALCAPDDYDFESEKTGCQIALYRATIKLLQDYKKELKFKLAALN